ncbi:MAG: 50S ribosomal protein L16 [Candidatus Bathyarchaeota archaeon]|nr:50S ribosomal protein L16 [Candidatus Bathyarchaeota archaeon]
MNARNFRNPDRMAYTRRKFMGGIPGSKIVKFTMGNTSKKFPFRVELINLEHCQIRHNSLESARIAANRQLELKLGTELYSMKVVPFPHIVLREHKRINVAQADRFQEGMKRPYGKPTGTAARVKRGEPLIVIEVEAEGVEVAKEALERAMDKFPMQSRIFVKENTV